MTECHTSLASSRLGTGEPVRVSARRAGLVLLAALVCGAGVAGARQETPRHPTRLTGEDWTRFSPREKELYLSGFLAGAAAEQARSMAVGGESSYDSAAVSGGSIEQMRVGKLLQFRFAPSVYAAQVDDFYWWDNHVGAPIVDVMITINGQMLRQQEEGAP